MAEERSKDETGNGRSRRRVINEVSFHSLRHTATSLLKNAGVSEAVAMDIIGHESKASRRTMGENEEQFVQNATLLGMEEEVSIIVGTDENSAVPRLIEESLEESLELASQGIGRAVINRRRHPSQDA
jgi:hypothetical protein